MIIGNDFSQKAKKVLKTISELSQGETDIRIEVKSVSKSMEIDKTEMKNLLEYLESKECIKIETMGGPFLYGDVSITKKGIAKSEK